MCTQYDCRKRRCFRTKDYANSAPINLLANVQFRLKDGAQNTGKWKVANTPFQFIGVMYLNKRGVDFAQIVIRGFDLSNCQFAIENPLTPAYVRAYDDEALALFKRYQFTYNMKRFKNLPILCTRISKYLSRGYMLVGFKLGDGWRMECKDVTLQHKRESHVHIYDGCAVNASMVFNYLNSYPFLLSKPGENTTKVYKMEGMTLGSGTKDIACGTVKGAVPAIKENPVGTGCSSTKKRCLSDMMHELRTENTQVSDNTPESIFEVATLESQPHEWPLVIHCADNPNLSLKNSP